MNKIVKMYITSTTVYSLTEITEHQQLLTNSASNMSCVLSERVWISVSNCPYTTRRYHSPLPSPQSTMGPQDVLPVPLMSVGFVPICIIIDD